MKTKTIVLVILAIIITILVYNKEKKVIIPKDSIRIRIVANSNDKYDVKEKLKVKKNVERELYSLLKNVKNVDEARKIINENIDNLKITIENATNSPYSINYGNNFFPSKTYKGIIYEEGLYESIVISLGNGVGDNWWCVLFPPLCLLEENSNTKDVEYQFFVKELIENYLYKNKN